MLLKSFEGNHTFMINTSSKLSHIVFHLFPLLMMPNESCKGKDEYRKNSRNFTNVSKPFNSTVIDWWTILISIYRGKVTYWVDKQLRTGLPFQVPMNGSQTAGEKGWYLQLLSAATLICCRYVEWRRFIRANLEFHSLHPDGE